MRADVTALEDVLEVLDVKQWEGLQDVFVQYTTGFHREGV
jgi:hypothetical protein